MIPIGLVTRNRHEYLDVTLRSLSASNLSQDHPLIIFDDASDRPNTRKYLFTNESVPLAVKWPKASWSKMGLNNVRSRSQGEGLKGKIAVQSLGSDSLGVVNGTCAAFCQMIRMFGVKHGIIIVQDDVAFNADWYTRIVEAANHPINRRPVGLVCGAWINKSNKERIEPMTFVPKGGVTAQCYYVTPAGIGAVLPFAQRTHSIRKGFDNKFCAAIRRNGTSVYRMHPAVCQHIGIASTVRSGFRWTRHPKGRVDYTAKGPYPMADTVRQFSNGE